VISRRYKQIHTFRGAAHDLEGRVAARSFERLELLALRLRQCTFGCAVRCRRFRHFEECMLRAEVWLGRRPSEVCRYWPKGAIAEVFAATQVFSSLLSRSPYFRELFRTRTEMDETGEVILSRVGLTVPGLDGYT
jgi:hypothetical protein